MGDVHYMISETAKRVGVESHVLRYWEDELNLQIGRTEMGHRFYTEDDVQLFNCIKELKEQGLQLRELKSIIPDLMETREKLRAKRAPAVQEGRLVHLNAEELETLLFHAMKRAMEENNAVLEAGICKGVTDKVSHDVDFLLQAKDRQEEERFRRLDHLIRQQQANRRESARQMPARYIRRILGEF